MSVENGGSIPKDIRKDSSSWEIYQENKELSESDEVPDILKEHLKRNNEHIIDKDHDAALMEEQLNAAGLDKLTTLPNKETYSDNSIAMVNRAIIHNKARKEGDPHQIVMVLSLDLNKFKQINDNLGHSAGDQVLKTFALKLQEITRGIDIVARPGGDEFTATIHFMLDADQLQTMKSIEDKLISRISNALKEISVSGENIHTKQKETRSVSVSVAAKSIIPRERNGEAQEQFDAASKDADESMLKLKKNEVR